MHFKEFIKIGVKQPLRDTRFRKNCIILNLRFSDCWVFNSHNYSDQHFFSITTCKFRKELNVLHLRFRSCSLNLHPAIHPSTSSVAFPSGKVYCLPQFQLPEPSSKQHGQFLPLTLPSFSHYRVINLPLQLLLLPPLQRQNNSELLFRVY